MAHLDGASRLRLVVAIGLVGGPAGCATGAASMPDGAGGAAGTGMTAVGGGSGMPGAFAMGSGGTTRGAYPGGAAGAAGLVSTAGGASPSNGGAAGGAGHGASAASGAPGTGGSSGSGGAGGSGGSGGAGGSSGSGTYSQSDDSVDTKMLPPFDQWFCLEYELDSAAGNVKAYLNDVEITALRHDGWPASSIDTLMFGVDRYGAFPVTDEIWFDDLVVDGARVGCTR